MKDSSNPWYEVTLIEGKNRQIRRMFEEIGHHVEKIKRVRYGPLTLDVEPGQYRELAPKKLPRCGAQIAPTGHNSQSTSGLHDPVIANREITAGESTPPEVVSLKIVAPKKTHPKTVTLRIVAPKIAAPKIVALTTWPQRRGPKDRGLKTGVQRPVIQRSRV